MEPICKICGDYEYEHHEFQPMPNNCLCGHDYWLDVRDVPPVCPQFETSLPLDDTSDCITCGHPIDCHKE